MFTYIPQIGAHRDEFVHPCTGGLPQAPPPSHDHKRLNTMSYRGFGKIALFWTDLVVPAERMCKGCADDVRKGCAGDAWKGCAKGCAGFSGAYFSISLAIVLIYKKQFVLWNLEKRYLPAPNNS